MLAASTSPLWMGDVVKDLPDGSYQVDLAGFLARDDIGIPARAQGLGGGEFKFVPELSAADPTFVKVLPKNAEFAARIAFRSDEPKEEMNNILPGENTLSIIERHSLIALPGRDTCPALTPTAIRSAASRWIFRSRLALRSSTISRGASGSRRPTRSAARSPVKKPIVFYVDLGMPERSAMPSKTA